MAHQSSFRVLVSTDLGGDPDDIQSLIHILHYTDILKLEGLISSPGPGSINRAAGIVEWVERTDLDYLRAHGHPDLMTEAAVLAGVRQGAMSPGAPEPDRTTDGSRWIVERATAPDLLGLDRPLWVLVWGSLTDVAQALHDEPAIAERIRIYYIGSSNTTADPDSRDYVYRFMQEKAPNLWWIENGILPRLQHDTFRGVYLGGDQSGEWDKHTYVEQTIRRRGGTHNGKYALRTGDAMPLAHHPGSDDNHLKEGDTASFLYLLSPVVGGVGDVDDATQPSWGGQFRRPEPDRYPNYYVDLDAPAEECQATINRWRVDFLRDWQKRWAWYD